MFKSGLSKFGVSKYGMRGVELISFKVPGSSGGEFSPASITNLSLWLDADDSSKINLSGSNITSWISKDSNSYVFSQSDPSIQPTLSSSSLNSKNTISFDGDYLESDNLGSVWKFLNDGTDFTVFFVVNPQSYNGVSKIMGTTNTTASAGFNLYADDSTQFTYSSIRSYVSSGTLDTPVFDLKTKTAYAYTNQWNAFSLHVTPSGTAGTGRGYSLKNNGLKQNSGNYSSGGYSSAANVNPLSTLFIGDDGTGAPTNSKLEIAEIIVYSKSLNSEEINSIYLYLSEKWNIATYAYETFFEDDFESYTLGSTGYPPGYSSTVGNGFLRIIQNPQRGGHALEFNNTVGGQYIVKFPETYALNNFTLDAQYNRLLTSNGTNRFNVQPNFGAEGSTENLYFRIDNLNKYMRIVQNGVAEQSVEYAGAMNQEDQRLVIQSNGIEAKFVLFNDQVPVYYATADVSSLDFNDPVETFFNHVVDSGNEMFVDDYVLADSNYPFPVPTTNTVIQDDFSSYSLGATPERLLSNKTTAFGPFGNIFTNVYSVINSSIMGKKAVYMTTQGGIRPYFVKNFSAANLRITFDTACRYNHDANYGQDEIWVRWTGTPEYSGVRFRLQWLTGSKNIRVIEYDNNTSISDNVSPTNVLFDSTHYKVEIEVIDNNYTYSLLNSAGNTVIAQLTGVLTQPIVPGAVFFGPHSAGGNSSAYGWEVGNVRIESLD